MDRYEKAVTDRDQLERIRALVIPPAWKFVRICPAAGGKIQAVGVDGAGRVQYLYHTKFAEARQRKKFAKIESFGHHLPRLRQVTNEHLSLDGFPKEKVLAIMIRLVNSLYIRVGGEQSVKHFRTFGITTLQNRHFRARGKTLTFEFVGKGYIKHRKVLVDPELAVVMKELAALGSSRKLFHFVNDDGKPRPVRPSDLNHYLKSVTAPEYSIKDFRTWGATLLAAIKLAEIGCDPDDKMCQRNVVRAVKYVAEQLGNTPAVCRASYIHPSVLKAYSKGITLDEFRPRRSRNIKRMQYDLEPEEKALLKMFQNLG
ncbi:MAG: DNA topoisomerase IB [Acidobacteria bacterium]|nr:DNA topoisomerase IB [Acidobacteriota bacterium]